MLIAHPFFYILWLMPVFFCFCLYLVSGGEIMILCKRVFCFFTSIFLCFTFVSVWFHPVDVYAEDNYTGSSAWQDWLSYWHSSLNVAVDDVTGGAFDADDLYKLRALQYAYGSMMYQHAASAMTTPDNYIPAGTIESGWYYRGGNAHSVTAFYYGQNGDSVNADGGRVVLATADDFTISVEYTPTQNITFPAFRSIYSYGYYYSATQTSNYVNTLTFTGTKCTGIISDYDFADSSIAYVSQIATYNTVITMDGSSFPSSNYVRSGYYSERPPQFIGGMLKDPNGQPISNTTQQFVRATVSNSFPDFVDALKNDLYTNYPTYIIDEIWVEPDTPIEPIYPTDFVTGIPKDWTIENPPLPTAPYIDFGQGDFDFSKPSEYLEEVVNEAEALDFWWWLTEKTFKKCGVFEYFLAFITLGFAMFALWRWGS